MSLIEWGLFGIVECWDGSEMVQWHADADDDGDDDDDDDDNDDDGCTSFQMGFPAHGTQ
jgi:hypothetical protein